MESLVRGVEPAFAQVRNLRLPRSRSIGASARRMDTPERRCLYDPRLDAGESHRCNYSQRPTGRGARDQGVIRVTVPPPRRSSGDWHVDPVALGVPGVRRPETDDKDDPLAWQADSLCAQTDPEAFFPEKGGSTREAKKICASCEVRSQCLEYALENDERFGIWGGLSERERRKLRKRA